MPCIVLLIVSLTTCCVFLQASNYSYQFEGRFAEWNHLNLVSLFLPKNPVILQAGGYYGDETLNFSHRWPDSRVISFEPNPHAFEILSSKTANINNVQVYNLALNDYSGVAPFYVCYGSSGKEEVFEHASSLLKPSPCMEVHYQGPLINVECTLLDEWCCQREIDHIDFMCLNLQGAELQILKSSPNILKTVTCIAVHTNFFPFRIGTTQYPELKKFIENSGFQLFSHWYREGLEGYAIFLKNSYFFNSQTDEFLKNNKIDQKYKRYYEPFFKAYYDLDNDEKDSLKNTLKLGYPYEGNIGIIIDQLARPGSLAIDIGSHLGIHTITMSRKVGPQGAVIAFEPTKKLYMELLHTLTLNRCENVIPICKALGDAEKMVWINNSHIAYYNAESSVGDLVETITLDSLNIDNLSIIKVDVENYEYFVLKGAKETILRNKPVIIFECWIGADYQNTEPREKANFDRVISLLESYGYEIYVIYSNDFIAFPAGETSEQAKYKNNFRRLDVNNFDIGLN